MKAKWMVLLGGLLLSGLNPLQAEEPPLEIEACYQAFADRGYTPKSVIAQAREEARFLAQKGEAGLQAYMTMNDHSWKNGPIAPPMTVMHCDEMRSAAFFLPEAFKALSTPGSLKKFQDAKGQHTFFNLCKKVHGEAQAAWVIQHHFWVGCKGPLRMGVLGVKVPGTPYMIQSSLPSGTISLEEFERALKP